jgi:hypothetical protein
MQCFHRLFPGILQGWRVSLHGWANKPAVTGIFNFYRASQTLFLGETLLEKGRSFAKIFLENKHAKGECYDKWILTKDLNGEVSFHIPSSSKKLKD